METTMTCAVKLYQGCFGRVALLDSVSELGTHAHSQCHVLIKARGAGTVIQVGANQYPLNQETVILVNAFEPHSKLHSAADGHSRVLALYIEPEWLSGICPDAPSGAMPGFFPVACARLPAHIRRLADQLVSVCFGASGASPAQWEAAVSETMTAIVQAFAAKPQRRPEFRADQRRISDRRIARAVGFMKQHLGESFSSEDLARMHGLSRPHFFSLFKECTDLSPALYMNMLRMEAALDRLADDRLSIKHLSDSLGFSKPHHFTRFFRHNLGIPPSEYRRTVAILDRPGTPAYCFDKGRPLPTAYC
jgi:AraC family transcriptional regulator